MLVTGDCEECKRGSAAVVGVLGLGLRDLALGAVDEGSSRVGFDAEGVFDSEALVCIFEDGMDRCSLKTEVASLGGGFIAGGPELSLPALLTPRPRPRSVKAPLPLPRGKSRSDGDIVRSAGVDASFPKGLGFVFELSFSLCCMASDMAQN